MKAIRSSRNPQRPPKTIVVVDDHPITRRGLRELIDREKDLVVCGEAGTAREAMKTIGELKPDLVVLDLNLPDKDGLELLKDLQAQTKGLPVLALSMHDEAVYASRILRAGGRGYVMKREGGAKVLQAIRVVLGGQFAFSESVTSGVLESLAGAAATPASRVESVLSDRELEVMRLLGQGWTSQEIARKLNLSRKTVEVHRAHIRGKLGLKTNSELLRHAIQWSNSLQ